MDKIIYKKECKTHELFSASAEIIYVTAQGWVGVAAGVTLVTRVWSIVLSAIFFQKSQLQRCVITPCFCFLKVVEIFVSRIAIMTFT